MIVPIRMILPGVATPQKIVQQPRTNLNYVPGRPNTFAQFQLAKRYDVIGLVAHNYLAGASLSNLKMHDEITLLSKEQPTSCLVCEISSYRAIDPMSPYTDFQELEGAESIVSSAAVFEFMYMMPNMLVLQTCIAKHGVGSWGRLFVKCSIVEKLPSAELESIFGWATQEKKSWKLFGLPSKKGR